MTDPRHPTGSDRIHEAIARLDPAEAHDAVINVQGDCRCSTRRRSALPWPASPTPRPTSRPWRQSSRTSGARRHQRQQGRRPASPIRHGRPARSISARPSCRGAPGPHYEHIGLYAYRRAALERFVALPRGVLEQREHLEQLRALEAGMRISVSLIDPAWLGVQVDTPADLARARHARRTNSG